MLQALLSLLLFTLFFRELRVFLVLIKLVLICLVLAIGYGFFIYLLIPKGVLR